MTYRRPVPENSELKILCVDDDEGIRESLGELLRDEGYDVTVGATAEEGIELLGRGSFRLVISDYALPGETGSWMIREAKKKGLLNGAEAMLITAHPAPKGAEGIKVFRKPVDVDDFLRHVHHVLQPAREDELNKAHAALGNLEKRPAIDKRPLIELILYISSASPSSLRAVRNIQKLLGNYDASKIQLTIADLSKAENLVAAGEDRVAFTPTLVRRHPAPRAWVLGDLQNAHALSDMLSHAGIEPR